jgi:2-C-methyl-D-erythritol 4-phosphate cytidylyltransferase/2-C-methyl-D-erythritol 2,4-cyclodiphosphate synthase
MPVVGAIIVAAGRGVRLGASVPKQLLDIGGQTLLQRSVAPFDSHPDVEELVVVLPADLVTEGPGLVGPVRTRCSCVAGGERRQDSVRQGFSRLSAAVDLVLVHDAARPFVDHALIDRVIAATREVGAAVPALAASDTVKQIDVERREVALTLARDTIWMAQTPQGFSRDVFTRVVALSEGDAATDEAQLAESAGDRVRVVDGDPRNVKITTADDLARARATLAAAARVGTGYDLHRLVAGRTLVLAGVAIPFDRGPASHSDGDVASHAIVDALLGAAAAGDIGRLFPDSDPQWKDAAGLDLLSRAVDHVRTHGWSVTSADVTVVLERPKLSPYIDQIRARLAAAMRITPDRVSVKAKTNEGVDAVGRGEAIAAHAVAVLAPRGER